MYYILGWFRQNTDQVLLLIPNSFVTACKNVWPELSAAFFVKIKTVFVGTVWFWSIESYNDFRSTSNLYTKLYIYSFKPLSKTITSLTGLIGCFRTKTWDCKEISKNPSISLVNLFREVKLNNRIEMNLKKFCI